MIRAITESDYPRLAEIWESSVRATHGFLSEEDFQYYKAHLAEYFVNVSLYGYQSENKLLGFIGVSYNFIEILFVDADSRDKGIGTALIKFVIHNCRVNMLDVNEQNTQAIGFYKRIGFHEISRSETDSEGKAYPVIRMTL